MWKSLKPGERVTLGDRIRHISGLSKASFGDTSYQVVKSELHYFEVASTQRTDTGSEREPERRIIRYIDIGYHFLVEVWFEQIMPNNIF